MEYMSCPKQRKKWGISEGGYKSYVKKTAYPAFQKWLYVADTKDAEKPMDMRKKGTHL